MAAANEHTATAVLKRAGTSVIAETHCRDSVEFARMVLEVARLVQREHNHGAEHRGRELVVHQRHQFDHVVSCAHGSLITSTAQLN